MRVVTGQYAGRKGPRTEEFMKMKKEYISRFSFRVDRAQPTVPQSKHSFAW